MTVVGKFGWAAVALAGAIALGIVASARGETVNAVWIVIAAVSVYLIAYRFYARFIATKVMALDPGAADPGAPPSDGLDYVRDRPQRPVRPPFRGDRRGRAAGRAGAGGADGLSAGHAVDPRRRGAGRARCRIS